MPTPTEIQNEIINNFSLFEGDIEQTLMYLMELGKKLPPMPPEHKVEEFIVKGCQSKVWVFPKFNNGLIEFEVDSNTEITRGLLYLLWSIWNKQTPETILQTDLFFIDKIGMNRMIGTQRSNGFTAMIQKMKAFATLYQQAGK
jgi:cysteine desulfuration protein SufE